MRKFGVVGGIVALAAAAEGASAATKADAARRLNPDGSVDVPAFVLPFSAYASPEAHVDMVEKFARLNELASQSAAPVKAHRRNPMEVRRELIDRVLFQPFLDAQRQHYSVTMTEQIIAGVGVQVFVPTSGVKPENSQRVLIDLHGGGFMIGWGVASQIESIPMAAVGGIKVISVNYRMFPEAHFPAASEDVASIYRELLKKYKPSQIGIYGGSAGGILASESMSWFQKEGLPVPSSIAIWSASLDPVFEGDSAYVTPNFGSYIGAPKTGAVEMPYFAGQDFSDPLVAPSNSAAVLAKFPPTLFMTGTRASDMSSTIRSHLDLLAAGVETPDFCSGTVWTIPSCTIPHYPSRGRRTR